MSTYWGHVQVGNRHTGNISVENKGVRRFHRVNVGTLVIPGDHGNGHPGFQFEKTQLSREDHSFSIFGGGVRSVKLGEIRFTERLLKLTFGDAW